MFVMPYINLAPLWSECLVTAFSCLDLCKLPSKMGTNLLLEVDCGAKSSWTKLAINIEFTIFDDQIGVVSRELLEDLERFATSSTARFESG